MSTETALEAGGVEAADDVARYMRLARSGGRGSYAYVLLAGIDVGSVASLTRRVQGGLEHEALDRLGRNIALGVTEVSDLLGIASRTLARRKNQGRLDASQSDRLLRFARILGAAIELFEGDAEAARRWLRQPQKAFEDQSPLQMARTEIGALEVERLIGRLEDGVFS